MGIFFPVWIPDWILWGTRSGQNTIRNSTLHRCTITRNLHWCCWRSSLYRHRRWVFFISPYICACLGEDMRIPNSTSPSSSICVTVCSSLYLYTNIFTYISILISFCFPNQDLSWLRELLISQMLWSCMWRKWLRTAIADMYDK